jgi:hypothetical protein
VKVIDLTNTVIGQWTIIERVKVAKKGAHWRVKCSCGIEKILISQNVRKGSGCHKCAMRRLSVQLDKDDQFGAWTVISESCSKNGRRWVCQCKCGTVATIPYKTLANGSSTGCFKCGRDKLRKVVDGIPVWVITQTRNSANERDILFDIDIKYLAKIFKKQKGLCALTGRPLRYSSSPTRKYNTTASIDRVDNSKGYVKGNYF